MAINTSRMTENYRRSDNKSMCVISFHVRDYVFPTFIQSRTTK